MDSYIGVSLFVVRQKTKGNVVLNAGTNPWIEYNWKFETYFFNYNRFLKKQSIGTKLIAYIRGLLFTGSGKAVGTSNYFKGETIQGVKTIK